MPDQIDCPTPLGYKEIAELLGVKNNTVNMWNWKKLMPEPDHLTINGHPAYDPETIVVWAAETGRLYTQAAADLYEQVTGNDAPPLNTKT